LENCFQLELIEALDNSINNIDAIRNLHHIRYLNIWNNNLIELPEWLINFPLLNGENLHYDENIIMSVRLRNHLNALYNKNNMKIYNDRQNVHSSTIHNSVSACIEILMNESSCSIDNI